MSNPHDVPFLGVERFVLRSLQPSDADGPYPNWFNDPEVCRYNSHHAYPYTREQALDYIEQTRSTRSEIVLAIEDRATSRHIGNVALQAIHPVCRSAEFSIVIGDREFWGCGVGLEVGRVLLFHGFDALNLHRIGCGTSEDNAPMRKLASGLGMREEGRRRGAMWKAGRFVDLIEYGVLADEFRAAVSSKP